MVYVNPAFPRGLDSQPFWQLAGVREGVMGRLAKGQTGNAKPSQVLKTEEERQ
jgi:hypothetical protein